MAHEVGHHLQRLTGTHQQVAQASKEHPKQANALSVATELQADCYAGVWSRNANDQGNVRITKAEFAQATQAAAAVGDDRIQLAARGRVSPESWTHGSAQQRQQWFSIGYESGNPGKCTTFS